MINGDSNIIGKKGGGASLDGDADGNPDGLQFGLGGVTTALIGGRKTTDAGAALSALGADSVTIISGAAAASNVAVGATSVVIGHDVGCVVGATSSVVIGDGANASVAPRTVVIGFSAQSSSQDNVTIGTHAHASGVASLRIGSDSATADAAGVESIAIGWNVSSDSGAIGGIGIGRDLAVNGVSGIIIGDAANAGDGARNICLGNLASVNVNVITDIICIGANTLGNVQGAIAIGSDGTTGAQATGAGAIAFGGDDGTNSAANASAANAVAIGSGSIASASGAWQLGIGTNSTADTLQLTLDSANILNITSTSATVAGQIDIEGYAAIGNGSILDAEATLVVDRDFSSSGSPQQLLVQGAMTTSGGTGNVSALKVQPTVTVNSGGAHPLVASVVLKEPTVTLTSGTVTTAATLYIENAPTEGGSNYALFVDSGDTRLDGNIEASGGIGVNGVTPPAQASHIANPTDLATSITAITAINLVLENIGHVATS